MGSNKLDENIMMENDVAEDIAIGEQNTQQPPSPSSLQDSPSPDGGSEPTQDSDYGEALLCDMNIIATLNQTRFKPSQKSKHLVPVDYTALEEAKWEWRNKSYEIGSRKWSFGNCRGYELTWVVENAPGYIDWCTHLPSLPMGCGISYTCLHFY